MKRLFLLPLLFCIAPITAYGQDCSKAAALMKHVYKPERLVEKKGCITVTGIIMKKVREKDGDFHVRLKLDPGQGGGLINSEVLPKGTLIWCRFR